MYRAFSAQASLFNDIEENSSAIVGGDGIQKKFEDFLLSPDSNGVVDASEIWDRWFPNVSSNVFISHSSRDASLAKKCAAWIYDSFGLKSFIDSELWGFSDDLLKILDEKYSRNRDSSGRAMSTYNYSKRNATTANVHMMLSYALTRMIDQTECVVFLESENSVPIKGTIDKTFSPWIFHELATIETIQINEPKRPRMVNASESTERSLVEEESMLKMAYPICRKRLIPMNAVKLNNWFDQGLRGVQALDWLYRSVASKALLG